MTLIKPATFVDAEYVLGSLGAIYDYDPTEMFTLEPDLGDACGEGLVVFTNFIQKEGVADPNPPDTQLSINVFNIVEFPTETAK